MFLQLHFSAVYNKDKVRLQRTDDEFLRLINYVSDSSGGRLCIPPTFFSCPLSVQHLDSLIEPIMGWTRKGD